MEHISRTYLTWTFDIGAFPHAWLVLAAGLASGAMLTMIASTMIPEAVHSRNPSVVGLGTIGLFKIGRLPVRWGVEVQYYVIQPDRVGPEWNFKIFLAPIILNPFKS